MGWGDALRAEMMAQSMEEPQLIALSERYISAVEAGIHRAQGWPATAYGTSKAFVHATCRMFARQVTGRGETIYDR